VEFQEHLMPSGTTIYRAIVMFAAGAIVVTGWQHFGPSADQVKSVVVSGIDMLETAWKSRLPSTVEGKLRPESGGAAPLFAKAEPATASVPPAPTAPSLAPVNPVGSAASDMPSDSTLAKQPQLDASEQALQSNSTERDRVSALVSRLIQIGAKEPKVTPWGSDGHLYRCSCRAALVDSPALTRHFESIAGEPASAVEQVVAKIEAWRTAQQSIALR
jgi:hypothetical protein